MTDKEQIIINGVDVGRCERHCSDNYSTPNMCYSDITRLYRQCNPKENQCDFYITSIEEQLARKTQECEELISEKDFYLQKIEVLDQECEEMKKQISYLTEYRKKNQTCQECYEDGYNVGVGENKELARYREALEEIEKYAKENVICCKVIIMNGRIIGIF